MRFLFFLSAWHLWGATGEGLCQETESAMEYDEDILVDSMNAELLQVKLELSKNQLDTVETTTTDADVSPTDDGTNTALLLKTCEDHCKFVGSAMWQYDPDCDGCKTSLMQNYAAQTPGVCASWCQYEGPATWQYDPNCGGCTQTAIANRSAGPVCLAYCQNVGTAVWQYNPDCQACKQVQLTQGGKGECKDYCQYEPSNVWQYDANCGGCVAPSTALAQANLHDTKRAVSSSQVCQDYCTYMGSVLWQYDPECQGCKPSLLTKKECKNYCKHEPSEVWSYDASCQGCTPTLMESEEGECQEHCRQIGPVLWHKVSGCDSCKSSLLQTWAKAEAGPCQDYCQYEGPTAWQYDPNCQGCGQSLLKVNATTKCSSWTGGTCIFSNCDASRGPTQCNWAKACTCPQNFCANDQGICIFDLASVWR